MFLFLIPLLLGFTLVGASAFTASYSHWWGQRGGEWASSILRNFLGIPIWVIAFIVGWRQPAQFLLTPGAATDTLGGLLIIAGSAPFIWGHVILGKPTHMPSVRDKLVRHGLYAHARHPIYSGGMLIALGLGLLKPTSTVLSACTLAIVWLVIQARLEEVDLLQRLPEYRQYMEQVPRFIPRFGKKKA